MSSVITYLGDLDLTLFHYVNSFCGQRLALDHIANGLEDSQLKGLAFSATFGVLWFQRSKDQFRRRQTLILLLVAIILSLVVARMFADLLPFRLRPMFAADIGYRAPLFIPIAISRIGVVSRVTPPRSSLSWRPAFGCFSMVGPCVALFRCDGTRCTHLFRPSLSRRRSCRSADWWRDHNCDQQRVYASADCNADPRFRKASACHFLRPVISVPL